MPQQPNPSAKSATAPVRGQGAQYNPDNPFHKTQKGYYDWAGIDETDEGEPTPVEILYDQPKKVLNEVDSPDVGMSLSLNPYQGCEHGCVYCYARNTHEYWGHSAGIDFERKIIAKPNAPELLAQELAKPGFKLQPLALSGNTDCYQPVERKLGITRRLLQVAASYGLPVGIITKNNLVRRDIDILQAMAERGLLHVYISLTTLDENLRRALEPRTATAAERLKTIELLSNAGIPVGVMVAPMIPGLNAQEAMPLIAAAAHAGARTAGYTVVRLNGRIAEVFAHWIRNTYPDRAEKVLGQIAECHGGQLNDSRFGTRMSGEGPIAEAIGRMVRLARSRYMAGRSMPPYNFDLFCPPQGRQASLF